MKYKWYQKQDVFIYKSLPTFFVYLVSFTCPCLTEREYYGTQVSRTWKEIGRTFEFTKWIYWETGRFCGYTCFSAVDEVWMLIEI